MVENIFDQQAEPGKGFYCASGHTFNSIRELEKAMASCSPEEGRKLFEAHTAGYKNDFSAWIGDVFGLHDLAWLIFRIKDPVKLSEVLRKYEQEVILKVKEEKMVQTPPVQSPQMPSASKTPVSANNQSNQNNQNNNQVNNSGTGSASNSANERDIEYIKAHVDERGDNADKTFDRVKKIKQHSLYNKGNFEDTVEDLKNRYDDLMRSVSEHRKSGQEMSIPAMMLRNIYPKIVYFQVSQNKIDHDTVVQLLDEAEQEINYAKNVKKKDLKEEVMEALGLSKDKKEE